MTPAQARVLVLLFLAASIDVGYSPHSLSDLKLFFHGVGDADFQTSMGYVRHEVAWIAGAIALVVLTGVSDTLGTWLAVLILALAVFGHGSQLANTINGAVGSATGGQAATPKPAQRTTIG